MARWKVFFRVLGIRHYGIEEAGLHLYDAFRPYKFAISTRRTINMTQTNIPPEPVRDFRADFQALAGCPPLSWQERLYHEHFAKNKIPAVIDLPTGLGKTMVMAIWLIARDKNPELPTRLIYVVDRRTVVDQSTDLAEKLVANCAKAVINQPPAISTLRGQLADNREWSRDPSRPAIIIGTVDLVGSALLFSGYRSSFKRRPLEAGLLGHDSLLVLDEAHLSRPFEKLLDSIRHFQKSPGKPLQVLRMSATSAEADAIDVFRLDTDPHRQTYDLWSETDGNGAETNPIKRRYEANKTLEIIPLDKSKKMTDKLASQAVDLARDDKLRGGKRIVVFVRKPDDAKTVANKIRESGKKSKSVEDKPFAGCVAVLTGTMRGLERDQLVEMDPVLKRFLNGNEVPGEANGPAFLVSTSAGEVGFDLNADHLVSDPTTIDSFIQRLGRVNRRGAGNAKVILVREPVKIKDGKAVKLEGLDLAIENTLELLKGISDVSPRNLATLKSDAWKDSYKNACSPQLDTVDLTDVLLDAWSMTSITEAMPGRPEVAPWLRGLDDKQAQTTVAWRAELELFGEDSTREKALTAIFSKHPIRPHESLTVNTGYLLEFLKQLAKLKDRPSDLMSTRVAIRLPRGQVVCRTLQELVDNSGVLYADSTLILPATFGGLNDSGMLDAESIPKVGKDSDSEQPSLDVADRAGYEQTDAARSRLRILIERCDGSWTRKSLPGLAIPESVELEPTYDKSTELFNALIDTGYCVRLVQPIKFDEEGDPVQSLVLLAPTTNRTAKQDQSLDDHVGAVEREARRIAADLRLAETDPICIALLFAARWHDEGKKAVIWQRFACNSDLNQPVGKMARSLDPKALRGYRHEFGSLLRICYPDPDRHDTV